MHDNSDKPVFFDATRRRQRTFTALAVILTIVSLTAMILFFITILVTPVLHFTPLRSTIQRVGRSGPHSGLHQAAPSQPDAAPSDMRLRAEMRYIVAKNEPIRDAAKRLSDTIEIEQRGRTIPAGAVSPGRVSSPVRAVFYVNWEKQSFNSLQEHISQTTHLFPEWLRLPATGSKLIVDQELSKPSPAGTEGRAPTYDDTALRLARQNGVAILPLVQNFDENQFQEGALHQMLASPARRSDTIRQLLDFVVRGQYQGINIDFETQQANDRSNLTLFMAQIAAVFHSHGLLVTQDIALGSDVYDLATLGQVDDFLVPMLYDEHADGTPAGPIASQGWYEQSLSDFLQQVPANRTVIGVGNYGYDWKQGSTSPDTISFEDATQIAQESRDGSDGIIRIDGGSLNPYFTYWDNNGSGSKLISHKVWLEDATTAYNEIRSASSDHLLGAALWRLGTEDPSVWQFFGKDSAATLTSYNPRQLSSVTYNSFGTAFQGEGDVLDVVRGPAPGRRTIAVDARKGMIVGENFLTYPSRYVIRRTGLVDQVTGMNDRTKAIALTFDDGPDPRWTPQILDILQSEHVPATFFVVGENAEAHPGLIAREWQMGMEIGNHSYTHPEMDHVSALRTKLELDATQRVIEAITGHRTTLFRAPNRADSEPSTMADFEPILESSRLGYVFIGEKIDPTDWVPGTKADKIIQSVLANANEGNCVLLHDAGGQTRAETVKALPEIIQQLKARGYRFVTVSQLMNRPKSEVFPAVPAPQRWAVDLDRAIFALCYWLARGFTLIFILAVGLGITRTVLMGGLALIQARREGEREFDTQFQPSVSVVIAAYNEAKVINKTTATLLASDYGGELEIVVVDDGSRDDTAGVVREAYADNPLVTVLAKPNGGKASALNLGIRQCRGEIVVALDADTIFTPDTVARLVRHFADDEIGAVSGNVKVGNRRNILTLWQATEYITSQNFDRRAFDALNCITVVPGAIGAWRKDAVILAGLYSSQTLAEDTDLTFKIRRLGYRIVTDSTALAYTEAPESLRDLAKQRFRWAFGTLQCLWKHRDALLRPRWGALGLIAMPSLWVYQIGFQAIAPIVDLTILWSVLYGRFITPAADYHDVVTLGMYWLAFSLVELAGAWLAFRLDGENPRLLWWLPVQRFGYRQIMYYVILKSLSAAIRGSVVGWGKLERKGTTTLPPIAATVDCILEPNQAGVGAGDSKKR